MCNYNANQKKWQYYLLMNVNDMLNVLTTCRKDGGVYYRLVID